MRRLRAVVCGVVMAGVALVAAPVETSTAAPAGPLPMLITIKRAGLSGQTITLPLDNEGFATEFTVDWDVGNGTPTCAGTTVSVSAGTPLPSISCTYAAGDQDVAGSKTISITPAAGSTLRHFGQLSGPTAGAQWFTGVTQWGDLGLVSLSGAFFGMTNLTTVPNNLPSTVTDLSSMFEGASTFNQDIGGWDTSNVTDMQRMFRDATAFNKSVNGWDVGELRRSWEMFKSATAFNNGAAPGACNVAFDWSDSARLTNTSSMFASATSFNATVMLDTRLVLNMESMFFFATGFNNGCVTTGVTGSAQPLILDTSGVLTTKFMFRFASAFNQDISSWNVGQLHDVEGMFSFASVFNQDISSWNVHAVDDAQRMFQSALAFDQDLSTWCFDSPVDNTDFALGSPYANTPSKHPSWTTCPVPAAPPVLVAPIVPVWRSTLDPAGGVCGSGPSSHDTAWSESFIGFRYLPGTSDCHRDGFEFAGWARTSVPNEVLTLPLVVDPSDGVARYFVSDNVDYVAVWREFTGPSELVAFGNFLCTRCTSVWLLWRAPNSVGIEEVVLDDRGVSVCVDKVFTLADWHACAQTGLTPGSSHTYSLNFARGSAASSTRSASITLRNR